MEAHAGTIRIGTGAAIEPRKRRLAQLLARISERRVERAERAYNIRRNGTRVDSLPGSEHSHLIRRPRGF
jgi:hypothetical protein